ncbi:hypothetical protein M422DRAFT_253204 [Sphaerobolus stellatus SS14]|uniref:NACHT domain-containing protein n=1 Tax=Sphaerobolus stellatus (strain SS14) TaxID=990650 RepID=A0A0C9UKJ1_SPHS4|nr:hypothetical protein M422DRAFT_253204 [Sphaerobolus stellatus SS14]
MDPLSITSAAAGFLGTAQMIYNIASRIVTAEKDEKKAMEEIQEQIQYFDRILSGLQSLIDATADTPGNLSQDYSELESCLKACTSQLQEFVDKFKPPLSRWKGLLHRFKWPLKDEERKRLVDLVDRCKSSIQLELTVEHSRTVQATAAAVQADLYTEKILKWLNVVEVNSNFDKARYKCHPGTGQWFLQSRAFEQFKGGVGECLWLHGIPGAGKTILSGSIIAALRNHVESKPNTGLAYFFFSYTDKAKRNTFNMLSSIAAQLAQRISNIPPRVVTLYNNDKTRPPSFVVLEVITRLARCFQQTYIVLDALDEIDAEERTSLVKALNEIIANATLSNIRLLMTSRREPYLIDGLRSLLLEEISLTSSKVNEDIKLYVTEIMEKEPSLLKWSVELRQEIVQTLTDKAQGMFRWVECQLESLKKCRRPHDVKKALGSLPKTLDETYERILLAVEEEDRVYVARLFTWVIFTSRPLCLDLLAEAIVFEPDVSELNLDLRFTDPKDILGFCSNMFSNYDGCIIDGSNYNWNEQHGHLTLSHYSVQEYLLSERVKSNPDLSTYNSVLKNGPSYIMDVHLKYFTFTMARPLRFGPLSTHVKDCRCLKECYPLISYSLHSLVDVFDDYYRPAIGGQKEREEQFAITLCEHFTVFQHLYPEVIDQWSPIVFLAQCGLLNGVQLCITHGVDVNSSEYSENSRRVETVLSRAMRIPDSDQRHAVAALLLEHGATDVIDVIDQSGHVIQCSPALEAVMTQSGYISSSDNDLARLLLQHGSLINSPYYPRGTLLAAHIVPEFWDPEFNWLPDLLSESGGCWDTIFTKFNGLLDDFVGEFVEYCVETMV